MSLFDGWGGRLLIAYMLWPVVVMLAWVVWYAVKADSIVALLKGIAATVMFAALTCVGWVIGSFVVLGLWAMFADWIGFQDWLTRGVGIGLMVLAMGIGSVLGWRWLSSEMPDDPREWQF